MEDSVNNTPSNNEGVSWREGLSDELKDNASLTDIKDLNGLAKRFIDTKKMVGDSMRMPTSDAGVDDISSFVDKILGNDSLGLMKKPDSEVEGSFDSVYDSMGRPSDAGGYEAGEGVDAEIFGSIAETAHKLGLSKSQYENLSLAHASVANDQLNSFNEKRDVGIKQLQGEWGGAYDDKYSRVTKMIDSLGGHEGLTNALSDKQIDSETLRLLDTIASQLGAEDSTMAKQMEASNNQTVDEAKQRRNEITNKLINDDLSNQQRQDLQAKLVKLSEEIAKYA